MTDSSATSTDADGSNTDPVRRMSESEVRELLEFDHDTIVATMREWGFVDGAASPAASPTKDDDE